eukprot:TRINITY_DN45360_c0_g1_i1.p2 TRINITY_DN45360_c0_g1~~TRINITY_DN45360_c0_g1_i1.p2  ORF type:complete len:104 (-),score=8.32 TRINITY_DN45360_c0_g1_i1:91-402(-)
MASSNANHRLWCKLQAQATPCITLSPNTATAGDATGSTMGRTRCIIRGFGTRVKTNISDVAGEVRCSPNHILHGWPFDTFNTWAKQTANNANPIRCNRLLRKH